MDFHRWTMNHSRYLIFLFSLCSVLGCLAKDPTPFARAIQEEVDRQEIVGGIAAVGDANGVIEMVMAGHADREHNRWMAEDDLFWIASMTKPVTACAIMKLQEQGKLQVNDSVAKYLPEFAMLKDAAGKPSSITIGQCLSHCSGLSEVPRDQEITMNSLEQLTKCVAGLPLIYAPGSQWRYCQSGINTAARVVEAVSGTSFENFLQQHFFDPLEMKNTSFYPTADQVRRLATSYGRQQDKWQVAPLRFLAGKSLMDRNRYPRGNGGLFSTAKDYGNFAQMLLGKGEWHGKRVISEDSVKQMTQVQTGDLKTGFTPGNGWGWGVCVVREPQGVSASLSAGSYGHGGVYGTQCWIDPVRGKYFLFMVQRADFSNSDGSGSRQRLQEKALAAPNP